MSLSGLLGAAIASFFKALIDSAFGFLERREARAALVESGRSEAERDVLAGAATTIQSAKALRHDQRARDTDPDSLLADDGFRRD